MGLWEHCLGALEHRLKEEDLITWVQPIKAFENEGELNLIFPNSSVAAWVKKNCLIDIQKTADSIYGHSVQLGLSVDALDLPASSEENLLKNQQFMPSSGGRKFTSYLNQFQTFDTFIEGKSNQIAKAVAQQIASNPDTSSNPLFLYSGVGLGKTHLMNAIGNERLKQHPDHKVLYLSSERFVSDMVRALRENKIESFKSYYRSIDMLLVDDVQFFAGKERSQEEFFHTFNTLFQNHKQIVMTCDRYPKDVDGLTERLKSRFASGLTQSIDLPDMETRAAIVESKAREQGIELGSETSLFIAEHLQSNVRELEGAVRRVAASANILKREPTVELAKEALKDIFVAHNKALSLEHIQKRVADFYRVSLAELLSKSRKRGLVGPRQVAMALSKELTNFSLPAIGDAFSRDHTTVMHACRKVSETCKNDNRLDVEFQKLKYELSNG